MSWFGYQHEGKLNACLLPIRPLKAWFQKDAAEPAAHTVSAQPPDASDASVSCRRRQCFYPFFVCQTSSRDEVAQLCDRAGGPQRPA